MFVRRGVLIRGGLLYTYKCSFCLDQVKVNPDFMCPIQTAYGEGDGTDSGRAAEAGRYPEIGGSAGTGHRLFIKF